MGGGTMSMHESDLNIEDVGASARRMAAERFACSGIGTDDLERGIIADMIEICRELARLADRPHDATAIRTGLAQRQAKGIAARLEARST